MVLALVRFVAGGDDVPVKISPELDDPSISTKLLNHFDGGWFYFGFNEDGKMFCEHTRIPAKQLKYLKSIVRGIKPR